MNEIYERTIGLIGEEKFKVINSKTIAVIGLGGVGGTCFEALVRSGFGHIIPIDFDCVSLSNLNRQLLYTLDDVKKGKVCAAVKRARAINNEVKLNGIEIKVDEDSIKVLDDYKIDFIVDAIDDSKAKLVIAKYAQERNIPFIMSLGMANKLNANEVIITKLNKTTTDPLAKKMRHDLKEAGIDVTNINVAFSSEKPCKNGTNLNSVIFPPSSAGLNIANFIFNYFIN